MLEYCVLVHLQSINCAWNTLKWESFLQNLPTPRFLFDAQFWWTVMFTSHGKEIKKCFWTLIPAFIPVWWGCYYAHSFPDRSCTLCVLWIQFPHPLLCPKEVQLWLLHGLQWLPEILHPEHRFRRQMILNDLYHIAKTVSVYHQLPFHVGSRHQNSSIRLVAGFLHPKIRTTSAQIFL